MTVRLLQGDCRDVLRTLPDASVDSIVTDPPYELTTGKKGGTGAGGFMGLAWDSTGVAFDAATWLECLRVLKPGGHLLAFSGTRTYHRMVCAIEDAGFEIRDQIGWVFGSGFPKSLDVSKAIDAKLGATRDLTKAGEVKRAGYGGDWDTGSSSSRPRRDEPATDEARQWQGWGTALKPAWEPICMARKPLIGTVAANVLAHGTGGLNVDGCRIEIPANDESGSWGNGRSRGGGCWSPGRVNGGSEPEGKRHDAGRWPANLIHDGSDEVLAAFPESDGQAGAVRGTEPSKTGDANCYGTFRRVKSLQPRGDTGSAARFFYCAKANKADRNDGCNGLPTKPGGMVSNTSGQHITRRDGGAPGPRANHHPTVKPTDLMRYLCRLVTPPGGVVLDPFMGSGSTLKAAELEGFSAIGIELSAEYIEIARRRITADAPLFTQIEVEA